MRSIGGYFGIEQNTKDFLHKGSVLLNSGRNALEYVLRAKGVKRIFLPRYTCNVIMQPVNKLGIPFEFYSIDNMLEPVFDFSLIDEGDAFLYTNYYSLKDLYISSLKGYRKNLIIDNAQALFSTPMEGVDTFYSPRKYFGLPDGGILYTNSTLEYSLPVDSSMDRFSHLLKRIDVDAEDGYEDFLENDRKLDNQEIHAMSTLTRALLPGIDFDYARRMRAANFEFLQTELGEINDFQNELLQGGGIFCYPLLMRDGHNVKEKLIQNKIYIPTFWPGLADHVPSGSVERNLYDNLICLPIDQRYSIEHMKYIINMVKKIGR